MTGKAQEGAKFSDYFEYEEPLRKIPSHRALALFRGRKEGILGLSLVLPEDEQEGREAGEPGVAERRIAARFGIHDRGRPADAWLRDTVRWARPRRSGCSARTSTTCCWRHRRAHGSPWGWIRGCAPG
jgi:uncharacterized protein